MRFGFLLLAIVIPSSGCAQRQHPVLRILPGSDHLVPGRVSEGTDTLIIASGEEGESRTIGILYLETRRHRQDGVEVLTRIEWMPGVDDRHVVADSFVLADTGLAPLSATPLSEAGRAQLRFGSEHVVHVDHRGGTTRVPVAGPSFYGNSMDVVLRSLPLRQGFEAVLPLYEADARASSDALVTVGGIEDVPSASGEICRAWRVRIDSREHGGTYWIDSRSFFLVRYQAPSDPLSLLRTRCGVVSAPV